MFAVVSRETIFRPDTTCGENRKRDREREREREGEKERERGRSDEMLAATF